MRSPSIRFFELKSSCLLRKPSSIVEVTLAIVEVPLWASNVNMPAEWLAPLNKAACAESCAVRELSRVSIPSAPITASTFAPPLTVRVTRSPSTRLRSLKSIWARLRGFSRATEIEVKAAPEDKPPNVMTPFADVAESNRLLWAATSLAIDVNVASRPPLPTVA